MASDSVRKIYDFGSYLKLVLLNYDSVIVRIPAGHAVLADWIS